MLAFECDTLPKIGSDENSNVGVFSNLKVNVKRKCKEI